MTVTTIVSVTVTTMRGFRDCHHYAAILTKPESPPSQERSPQLQICRRHRQHSRFRRIRFRFRSSLRVSVFRGFPWVSVTVTTRGFRGFRDCHH